MFGALLAYGVMGPDGLGWHWYLGLAAIPLALVLFFFPVCYSLEPSSRHSDKLNVLYSLFPSLHGTTS